MKLAELYDQSNQPKDFFHALTMYNRIRAGYPQEFGFHHHADKDQHYGVFATHQSRGKVFKTQYGKNAGYHCMVDENNLLDPEAAFEEFYRTTRISAHPYWKMVGTLESFETEKDPCFLVLPIKGGALIRVKHDDHPLVTN